MGLHDYIDVALGLGAIASTLGSAVLGYRLLRRDTLADNKEKRLEAIERSHSQLENRHNDVVGFLKAKLGYTD